MQVDGVPISIETILHLVEIVALVGGGFSVAYRLGKTHSAITAAIEKQDAAAARQAAEISELKTEIKKLGDVLTALAVQENRLDMHERKMDRRAAPRRPAAHRAQRISDSSLRGA